MSAPREPPAGAAAGSALAALQGAFQLYLLRDDPGVEGSIAGTDAGFRAERLGIYRHAYFTRLANVLREDFKALAACMGDEAFADMAARYAKARPSTDPSIRWFGGRLPGFLADAVPYCQTPYLAELATFEWALTVAFDAPDESVIAEEQIAALRAEDWAGARARFHPSVQRLDLAFDVPATWRAVVKDGAKECTPPAPRQAFWVVWRHELTPHYRVLEVDEAWAMDALRAGQDFGAVCEGMLRWQEDAQVPLRFASLLKSWIAAGMIAGILD